MVPCFTYGSVALHPPCVVATKVEQEHVLVSPCIVHMCKYPWGGCFLLHVHVPLDRDNI